MSNLILFFLLILFTIDKKPMFLLLDFIGIILTLAISILINNRIDMSLISYVLLIIYGSAIIILFGFIIMLYHYSKNNNNFSIVDLFVQIKSKGLFISLFPKLVYNKTNLIVLLFLIIFLLNFEDIRIVEQLNVFKIENNNVELLKITFENLFNCEQTWLMLSIIINILFLVMLGIIYILT